MVLLTYGLRSCLRSSFFFTVQTATGDLYVRSSNRDSNQKGTQDRNLRFQSYGLFRAFLVISVLCYFFRNSNAFGSHERGHFPDIGTCFSPLLRDFYLVFDAVDE